MRGVRGFSTALVLHAAAVTLTACTGTLMPAPNTAAESAPTVNPECPANSTPVGPGAGDLIDALAQVEPGDTLSLSETTYIGNFEITVSGTADAPIVLCGSGASILDGGTRDNGYALHLSSADHWHLTGFTVTNAAKGIVLDASSHNILSGLEVSQLGEEGIHFRADSSDNVLESSRVFATGLVHAEFGEGVYVGSAESNWCRYAACEPDTSDRNIIRDNTIDDTTAEAIDVKEGTTAGEIRGNTISLSAGAVVESAINLKGNAWIVDANTVIAEGGDGIRIHSVVDRWGSGNVVTSNSLASGPDRLDIEVVGDARATGNLIGCDNRRTSGGVASMNVPCR